MRFFCAFYLREIIATLKVLTLAMDLHFRLFQRQNSLTQLRIKWHLGCSQTHLIQSHSTPLMHTQSTEDPCTLFLSPLAKSPMSSSDIKIQAYTVCQKTPLLLRCSNLPAPTLTEILKLSTHSISHHTCFREAIRCHIIHELNDSFVSSR